MLPETSKTVPMMATYVVPSRPSCFPSSSRLIASSFGGLSFGGSLGANFLDSWTLPVSDMADVCGCSLRKRLRA